MGSRPLLFFDIEGEILTKQQVIDRGVQSGLRASTVKARLEKGNRTWKNLLEPTDIAISRSRRAFDTLPKRER